MASTRILLREAEQLAREQHGVISHSQLRDLGVDSRVVARLASSGQWRPYLGLLVVLRAVDGRDEADAAAMNLRLGAESRVTGPTALRLLGKAVPDRALVAWCPRTSMPRCPDVRILRDDIPRTERRVKGLRLVGPVDALLDTIVTVEPKRAAELLDRALQQHWISTTAWRRAVAPRLGKGRAGASTLRMLGLRVEEGTHSDGERRVVRLLRTAGIEGWVANYPARGESGLITAELDIAFPDLRLAIEIDGFEAHSDPGAMARDHRRQNDLVLDGWQILRFTWHQIVYESEWVLGQILQAIAARASS